MDLRTPCVGQIPRDLGPRNAAVGRSRETVICAKRGRFELGIDHDEADGKGSRRRERGRIGAPELACFIERPHRSAGEARELRDLRHEPGQGERRPGRSVIGGTEEARIRCRVPSRRKQAGRGQDRRGGNRAFARRSELAPCARRRIPSEGKAGRCAEEQVVARRSVSREGAELDSLPRRNGRGRADRRPGEAGVGCPKHDGRVSLRLGREVALRLAAFIVEEEHSAANVAPRARGPTARRVRPGEGEQAREKRQGRDSARHGSSLSNRASSLAKASRKSNASRSSSSVGSISRSAS